MSSVLCLCEFGQEYKRFFYRTVGCSWSQCVMGHYSLSYLPWFALHYYLLQSWHQEIVRDVIGVSGRAGYLLIYRLFLLFADRNTEIILGMAWKHQVVCLQMKERNVNGGQRRKRDDQRCSIRGWSVDTLYSGSQPFNPPPLLLLWVIQRFWWFLWQQYD